MAERANYLQSFESIYLEFYVQPTSASKVAVQKELFWGNSTKLDFSTGSLNRRILHYHAAGDASLRGTQYFTNDTTAVALALFRENPCGRYWDELTQLQQATSGSVERERITKQYLAEYRGEIQQLDRETSQNIYRDLGAATPIELQSILTAMVAIKIQGDATSFWATVTNQRSTVVPISFRCWHGNERTLLCECGDTRLLISLVTS